MCYYHNYKNKWKGNDDISFLTPERTTTTTTTKRENDDSRLLLPLLLPPLQPKQLEQLLVDYHH